jgi:hypothetical protein
VLSGASPETDLHLHPEDITMRDDFSDQDLETPTENDLDLAYGSKYLGTTDLGSRRVRARIEKVRKRELTDREGQKKMKFIFFFDTLDKPLVLNTTNMDEVIRALGRVPAKWVGAVVGVYVDPNVMFAGKKTGGVRLRVFEPAKAKSSSNMAPKPKPAPAGEWPEEPGDPGFEPDRDGPDLDQAA